MQQSTGSCLQDRSPSFRQGAILKDAAVREKIGPSPRGFRNRFDGTQIESPEPIFTVHFKLNLV